MTTPDIREGDLVKATRKGDPDVSFTARVTDVARQGVNTNFYSTAHFHFWDIEVLDRPLPPIDQELLDKVCRVYADGMGYIDAGSKPWRPGITAVINYLREHDTYNKESK